MIPEITCEKLFENLSSNESICLIDVREPEEWEHGIIPTALLIPLNHLGKEPLSLSKDSKTPIILYCAGGYRSQLAGDKLSHQGYSNLFSLKGGIKKWIETKLPIQEK